MHHYTSYKNRSLSAFNFCWLLLILLVGTSCKKYLEARPDEKLATPASLQDLQLILDNYYTINTNYPAAAEVLSDNYYITSTDWSALSSSFYRNLYLWQKDDGDANNYAIPYGVIQYCNTVLDNLENIRERGPERDHIKGSALMVRAAYWYALAQLYAPPYQQETAGSTPGIPIRLTADYAPPSVRATVQQTYDRIKSDLSEAVLLLPEKTAYKTRPSKAAAYGWLARTSLVMHQYDAALSYADSCLQLNDSLMDYNSLNAAASAPVPRFNKEVIFQLRGFTVSPIANSRAKVDSLLYNSYAADDLRKTIFFRSNGNGTYSFKGDYDGSGTSTGYVFGGIVTDEMYLIRAECYARKGQVAPALNDLNTLLINRWRKGTFVPLAVANAGEALALVLAERRKELLGRGTRWTDIRRLSKEPAHAIIPRRFINGQWYELAANSPRYTLLLPADVIRLTGMPQNP